MATITKSSTLINRRSVLLGLITAPAIVKYGHIMPIRGLIMPVDEPLPMLARWVAKPANDFLLPGLWVVTGTNEYNERVTLHIR
jgi:hypothetical protein